MGAAAFLLARSYVLAPPLLRDDCVWLSITPTASPPAMAAPFAIRPSPALTCAYGGQNPTLMGKNWRSGNPNIPQPALVRYAWADNPEGCNLTNGAGLPTSPFDTRDLESA